MLGQPHHQLTMARLIEAWADDRGLDLVGVGSWVEAESYILGTERAVTAKVPDFVVIIGLSGDKLDAYAALGVAEVWLYEGSLTLWALDRAKYRRVFRSRYLCGLDPDLVTRCMLAPSQRAAIIISYDSTFPLAWELATHLDSGEDYAE